MQIKVLGPDSNDVQVVKIPQVDSVDSVHRNASGHPYLGDANVWTALQEFDGDLRLARYLDGLLPAPGTFGILRIQKDGNERGLYLDLDDLNLKLDNVYRPEWWKTSAQGSDWAQAVADADAAAAAGNGTVVFSPGTYGGADHNADGAVFVPSSNVSWVGAGMEQTTLTADSADDVVVRVNNVDQVTIRDFTISQETTGAFNGAALEGGTQGTGTPATNVTIERVFFRDVVRGIIAFDSPKDWIVHRCRFENVRRNSCAFNDAHRIIVSSSQFMGFADDAIAFHVRSQDCLAIGNTMNQPKRDGTLLLGTSTVGFAVKFHSHSAVAIGNTARDMASGFVSVKQDNGGSSIPGNIAVTGNTLDGMVDVTTSQAGIELQNVGTYDGGLVFHGNTFRCASSTENKRYVWVRTGTGTTARVVISNNIFEGDRALTGNTGIQYTAGAFDAFYLINNSITGTAETLINIDTDEKRGDCILRGNRLDIVNGQRVVRYAGFGVNYLEFQDNRLVGDPGVSKVMDLQSTALDVLRFGNNHMPDVAFGDYIASGSGVTTLLGRIPEEATIDFPSVADGAVATANITVFCRLGMIAEAGIEDGLAEGAYLTAHVTAANTVTVTLVNHSGAAVDPASVTVRVVAKRDQ